MSHWKQHPLSAAYPPMSDDEFEAFRADILENGLKDAVVIFEGQVLDGWHRVQACQGTKIEIRTKDYKGDDPGGYVISKNGHRRHNTKSQLAGSALKVREISPRGNPNFRNTEKSEKPSKNAASANVRSERTLGEIAKEAGVSKSVMADANTAKKGGKLDEVISGKKSAREAAKEVRGTESNPPAEPKLSPLDKAKARIRKLEKLLAEREEIIRDLREALESEEDSRLCDADQKIKFEQLRAEKRALESQLREKTGLVNQWQREALALRKKLGK